jgi:hypothetical protein
MTRLTLVVLLLAPAVAVAQPNPQPDPKSRQADALFEEAKALEDAGQLKEACERFDEALGLNPAAIGAMIAVAKCDARFDRVASAVALYISARDHAREAHADEFVALAEDNINTLAPVVPHLQLVLAELTPDLAISIDGKRIAIADVADIQLDPGPHDIVVVAPRHHPHHEHVVLAKKDRKAVKIAALERVGQLGMPIAITAAGGVVLVAGIVTGAIASSNYHSAVRTQCMDDANMCSPSGLIATNHARTLGDIGTGIGIAGVAAIAVGGFLGWRAWPRGDDRGVAVVPVVGDGGVGVAATGRF